MNKNIQTSNKVIINDAKKISFRRKIQERQALKPALPSDTIKQALGYKKRGWEPIPAPDRGKYPGRDDWEKERYAEKDIPQAFAGKKNIAVLMGKASKGLTDVDCDWPEALATAPFFLPETTCFGRRDWSGAHWLYYTELAEQFGVAKKPYEFPTTDPDRKKVIVEILIGGGGKGQCSIFPPSTTRIRES